MTSTLDASTEQIPIDFRDPAPQRTRQAWHEMMYDEDQFGIWSCKFSADGNEVIAGGSSMIFGACTACSGLHEMLIICQFTIFLPTSAPSRSPPTQTT